MEQSTGITGEMKLTGDHNLLAQQVKDGKIHLAVFHGFEYGWARQLNPDLRPLVIAVSHHKTLHAHLVVRKDSPYECCADLKGKILALPSGSREHCHLYLERRCPGNGIEPKKFFARITKPDDHTDALDDLVEGKVDAVIVDRVGLDDYQKNKRARSERLRVLHQSETFPAAVIVYQTGQLSESVLKKFRDGLVSANKTERGRDLLRLCKITGFDEVPPEYETLLNEIVKAYPPPPAKK
jgi:ABC-type phosphate/phosphonate transport system substrate-binding protein